MLPCHPYMDAEKLPEAEWRQDGGATNRIAATVIEDRPAWCNCWRIVDRPCYSGQGLGGSLWLTHDHGPPRKRALSVCPLPYQKHWQNQKIPRLRFVWENCPCLRYNSLGLEQCPARWSAWWHGGQASEVPEHCGTCGHSYTHQGSYQTCPDEPPLAAGWAEDTVQATHPGVKGAKRTCSWIHCRPPTRVRANSGTEVGGCPPSSWA